MKRLPGWSNTDGATFRRSKLEQREVTGVERCPGKNLLNCLGSLPSCKVEYRVQSTEYRVHPLGAL
ncbi:hypothetical protein [Microcoleus sp. B9-D4]|uniref:hypothetical protein n=1 Tax=Microcoleus sp. B9-D4 TaxID=2818711 RepID=UPI002FCF938E